MNNGDLNQVTWEQRVMEGDPKFDASQVVPDLDYAELARTLGFEGVTMKKPEDVVPGWERALAARKPVVVDAHVDPEVPPLPPHIRFEQAKEFMASALRDPSRGRMARQSIKQMFGSRRGGEA